MIGGKVSACPAKNLNRTAVGLSRPSTSFWVRSTDVNARHKAGHDDGGLSNSLRGLV
jgi:hypothetical protein